MLCPKCNTQNRDNARFCKVCGYSFTQEDIAANHSVSVAVSDQQSATSLNDVGASANTINTAQEAQAVEVVVQPETVASAQPVQNSTLPEDDISLAPTQILSPQEMMAFQARRWQHDTAHGSSADVSSVGTDVSGPHSNEQATYQDVPMTTDVADAPTVMMSQNGDVVEGEAAQIPPPPPPQAQEATTGSNPGVSSYAEQAAAPPVSVTPPVQDAAALQQEASQVQPVSEEQSSVETPAVVQQEEHDTSVPPVAEVASTAVTAASDAPASTLVVGTLVGGRYEVVQVLSTDEHERVYQVTDHQGYQHCWNCGSEQNAEGDEFCIDCGAELLNASYILHEYSATATNSNDAHVLQGTIANTFVEQGKTYVVEQQHTAQMAFPNGVHILAASDSDAGNVRRSEPNEDSTLVLQLQRVHESMATPVGVFIIADGMGGHDNGQGASRMAINVISDKIVRELLMPPLETEKNAGLTASVTPMEEDALIGVFKGAVEEANNVLVQTNQHDKTDMGSTITGFMIVGDSAFIINVGDSRTYMLREGTLYQLTNDHSLVAQLLAGGLIEPDDVYTHPQRSQIFRSLGDKMNVQVDDFKQQLLPGDILLSCSDGIWEMVRNPQITDILTNAHDPQTACTQLIEAANANGGEDNVSAVVVFVR